jgi:hypothetical protein
VATAAHVDHHRDAGLEALLTEDVLRFATIQEPAAVGAAPARLESEWRRPGVPDAVDLVVTGPMAAAIEFKCPREPREANAAWTQHLGVKPSRTPTGSHTRLVRVVRGHGSQCVRNRRQFRAGELANSLR